MEDKLLLEYDDSLVTTISTELSIIQAIVFPFWVKCGVSALSTHMNIRVLSKADKAIESLAFQRIIVLLRTDRDHEQKLVLTRLFALHPVAELFSPCSAMCIEAPKYTINIRFSVSLAPSQENKT